MADESDNWDARLDAMYSDGEFMNWLEKYEPDHSSTYSGTLLGMYDAYKAGKEAK